MQPKFTLLGLVGFRVRVLVFSLLFLLATINTSYSQALINESFNTAIPLPTGWAQQNLSSPAGAGTWFQGNPANFPANSGAGNAYISTSFASGAGVSTLSNWLITPVVNIVNGSTFSFFTRTTTGQFPDRLQLRMSLAGSSVNVGASATSVGDFTNLLQDVNPTYTNAGYPLVWTKFTINITGVPTLTSGRFAFRYFVENGGPSGANSDLIGVDDVLYTGPCEPISPSIPVISSVPSSTCAGTPIILSILGGSLNGSAEWKWYSGSCGGTLAGTGTSITVTPLVTTTYYARGEGGCVASGLCGSQIVTVTPCTCLTPDVATICAGSIQPLSVTGTFSTFSGGAITIVDNTIANPYPSTINVTGLPATGAGVSVSSVTINGLSHTFPSDIDILLQSPTGQNVVLMSDAGGGTDAVNANVTLSDAATSVLPAVIVSGTFLPTNIGATDNFIAPGPGSVTQATPTLGSLTGTANPNGGWKLFIVDDVGGDFGTITSWSITFRVGPTAVWTANPAAPNTIFTNAGGTVAYVGGTQLDKVWVKPTVTTTYTATITGGPCSGANNVTVNVNPLPVITVTPNPGGCSPATLTASGGIIYNWSGPSGTLSNTTGPTVIATTPVNANYSVTGIGANGCTAAPVTVPVTGSSISAVISSLGAPPVIVFNQGFEATTIPTGWAQQNLSIPIGTTPNWIFGSATVLSPAQSGSPNSYVLGNFNNVAGDNTISNWLFTPTTTLSNGDQLTFWTRTVANPAFPDRLQIRMSTNGASVNVGTTNVSVGDFTTLLLDINPTLTTTGYPSVWTLFTANVSGLAAPILGRLAFRYFVTNGGSGANSDNIGIDNVTYLKPAGVTCAFNTSSIKVDITGGTSPYTVIYSDGTTNRTITGYVSGTPIQVTPGVTTTYTIVSVTGSNNCSGSGNTGTAVITVTPPPSITTQPVNRIICDGQGTTFTVAADPAIGNNYQWQVSIAGGSFTNLSNGGVYSGVTTPTLTLTGATTSLNGNAYRVVITGACPPAIVTSTAGILTINVAPTITTQPVNITRCVGATASFSVVATGNAPTYQWQVSTNLGLTWTNITGATAATFSVTASQILNNNQYRAIVTVAPCATTVTTNAVSLTVNPLPTVTISSPVLQLIPGRTSTITAVSTPAAVSYLWTLNGATVTGVTGNTLTASINGTGTYRATATDANGCTNSSNNLVIGIEASDHLFIYPNPTMGVLQARLYYGSLIHERREVTIYNAQGVLIAKKNYDFFNGMTPYLQMDFDLTAAPAGTYLMKVAEKNTGRIVAGYFIIQR